VKSTAAHGENIPNRDVIFHPGMQQRRKATMNMIDPKNTQAAAMVELTPDEMGAIEGGGLASFVGKVLADIEKMLSTGEGRGGGSDVAAGNV
jgi:hypothetical protein